MSIFLLKLVAIFFMFVDHVKYAFPTTYNFFTLYFGRIAFPIFAFCAIQASIHTKDIKKYIKRLFIAGLISEIPFLLFYRLPTINSFGLNIEFTLILGVIASLLFDEIKETKFGVLKGLLIVILLGISAEYSFTDYGFFGVILIFSFSILKESKLKTFLASGSVVSGKYIYRIIRYGFDTYYVWNWVFTLVPIFLILLYNGKKGKNIKWFFYIFYPLHLLLLYLFSPYTFNIFNL